MDNITEYLIPVLAFTLLCAGWIMVQMVAKKMRIKNHIDGGGCCGACDEKAKGTCDGKNKSMDIKNAH